MAKLERETTGAERIFHNTEYVLNETIQCMRLTLDHISSVKPERAFLKLFIERVITNLYQLIKAYKTHTNFNLGDEEEKSFSSISNVRQALVHASTSIEAISKELNSRGHYNIVGPNCPNAIRSGDVLLGNNFPDDIKVFYGQSFILIYRDLLKLVCRVTDHYNTCVNAPKISHDFIIANLYSLTDVENK